MYICIKQLLDDILKLCYPRTVLSLKEKKQLTEDVSKVVQPNNEIYYEKKNIDFKKFKNYFLLENKGLGVNF